MIFKCHSSEKLIAMNTLHEVVPPGTHFATESTEAMQIKCLAQGHNVLMPGFEPSTYASRNRYIVKEIYYKRVNKDSFSELKSLNE